MNGITLADADGCVMADSAGRIVDEQCAPACCDGCTRLRRYERCAVNVDDAPCAPAGPAWLWVCEDLRCVGNVPGSDAGPLIGLPPPVILWRSIGYRRTETVVDAAEVPAGELIWNAIDAGVADPQTGEILVGFCAGSCSDSGVPRFTCPLWEEASLCPGQGVDGKTLPRVFVFVRDGSGIGMGGMAAGQCGTTRFSTGAGGSLLCFEFRVGLRPWHGALPVGAVAGVFTAPGNRCCDCLPGCTSQTAEVVDCLNAGRVRRLSCCCACSGLFRSQFQYRLEIITPAAGAPGPEVYAGSGTAASEFGEDCVLVRSSGDQINTYEAWVADANEPGGWRLVRDGGGGVYVADQVCIDAGPNVRIPTGGNGGGPFLNPWLVRNPATGVEEFIDANFKCPAQLGGMTRYTATIGTNETEEMTITHTGRIVRCGFVSESWGGTSTYRRDGVVQFTRRFRGSRTAQRDGAVRCEGGLGCGGVVGGGGAGGASGRVALGSVVEPVPRDRWPMVVAAVAMLRRGGVWGDAGVGDTIARVIGPVGGDAFKAWYEGAFGEDCGCEDRQRWLNARFPYALG